MRRRPPVAPALSRRLSRLRRRVEVRALAKAARELGIEAWIVGGAVRDACLGIDDAEIDAAISGDAETLAKALEAAGMGRAVFLSRDRPGPRVFRVAGKRPVDIAELEGGSIDTDLRRRDFTVNAMAVSVAGGEILDPFGGADDLARRRLRPVRAENLLEDPLRALRAARLFGTLGLRPDSATLAAARAAAPALPHVAAERIGTEMSRILGSPRSAEAMAWAARAGLLPATLGVDVDRKRSRGVVAALRSLDDRATARLPESRRRRLRLAAIGLRLGLDGPASRRWLSSRRLPRQEVEDAAALADFVRQVPRSGPRREAWRWRIAAGQLACDAVHLAARGSRPPRDLARLRKLARAPVRRISVTGGDVMSWLGIPPGPRVGAWLTEIAVAAASGEVKSRREARNWLSGQVRDSSSPL